MSSIGVEMQIITKVMAEQQKQKGNDTVDANRYHAHMQILSSRNPSSFSPTPTDSPFSSATTSKELVKTTKILSDQNKDGITPYAINPGDSVHVLWNDDTQLLSYDIFYKRAGADFDPTTVNLSNNMGASSIPAIAVSSSNIHIVWHDDVGGSQEILYRKSTDGGATFGPIINLSNDPGDSTDAAIAVSGNIVHVVWEDDTPGNDDVFYRRSTDGGATFTEPIKNLSSNVGNSGRPDIAVSGNNVHVVWHDSTPGNLDILYRRSLNEGSTFPNIIMNLSNNAGGSAAPAVAAIEPNVHVVWEDNTPGESDIFYRRSTDSGTTFTEPIKNLSSNTGESFLPDIAALGNNIHVVWEDNTGTINKDIFYRKSLDGGATFPNIIKNLSGNAGGSHDPAIALSGTNVYVVWDDNTGLSAGNFDILYRTSASNGDTFPSILTNLSNNAEDSAFPAIGVS